MKKYVTSIIIAIIVIIILINQININIQKDNDIKLKSEANIKQLIPHEQCQNNIKYKDIINDIDYINNNAQQQYFSVPVNYKYQDLIISQCEIYDLEPSLVLALIWQESTYNPNAVSRSGESFGLMQLHNKVHPELAKQLEINNYNVLDPEFNIIAGTLKLKQCVDIWLNQGYSKEEAIYRGLNSYNFGHAGYLKYIETYGTQWKYADKILEKQKILEMEN